VAIGRPLTAEMIHRPLPLHDRLDWAELKLARLDEAVETFLQDQAVTTVSKPNADATEYVISVEKGIDSIPFDIGMMIGEVAHHARSTLDWLAWSIARNPCNDTTFPIWTSPSIDKNGKLIQPFVAGGLAKDAKRLVKLLLNRSGEFGGGFY